MVLTGLRLENIALIDGLELSFDRGFTVLTGETGAGKSLLLDALDALLGGGQGSQGARLVRQGCSRGLIEASFDLSPPVRAWLVDQQLDLDEPELLLSREWRLTADRLQSRSRLNGVAVNRAQLLELRPLLLELTAQGQTRELARPGQQRRWLDRFGGDPLAAAAAPVRSLHRAWKEAAQALAQARSDQQRLEADRQLAQQRLDDLEAAQLDDPLERQRLQEEQDRLSHGVRLQQGVTTLLGRLVEGEEGTPSALDHLGACDQELQLIGALDASLEPLRQRCGDVLQQVQDLARELDRYGARLDSDPESLATLQERIAQLKALERRHGQELAGLIVVRDRLRQQLAPGAAGDALQDLEKAEAAARHALEVACARLRELRILAAEALQGQLMASLRPLGLANVRFCVAVEPTEPKEDGADRVVFLFSANPGQPLAPLQEVASGGEMSRFLLALTTCLAAADPHVTLLFDEIDSGVSGRVSGEIAALLRRLAQQRQVFCVTHQPLLAAAADHHFQVSKRVEQGQTLTRVSALRDAEERQRELVELAGGDSGEARRYAASLLGRGAA